MSNEINNHDALLDDPYVRGELDESEPDDEERADWDGLGEDDE